MERYESCRDAVMEIVEAADHRFGERWYISAERLAALEAVCEQFDALVPYAEPENVDVCVDVDTTDVVLGFDCLDLVLLDNAKTVFLELLDETASFCLRSLREDCLRAEFYFSGLWVHA